MITEERTMDDEQLKPCPFCGEAPGLMVWNDASRPMTDIECVGMDCITRGCEVRVEGEDHERRAIAAWNTRPIEDALRAENDRLRTAIDDASHELGVPVPGTPAPVANAARILLRALGYEVDDDHNCGAMVGEGE